jgi:hypothetical protein
VSNETTLGYLAGSDATQHVIAQYAREQARIAGEAPLGEAEQHISALNDFADFMAARPRHDQRLVALHRLMAHAGDSETYVPGEQQARLFGMLGGGSGAPTPLPDATLSELVAAAVEDHLSTAAEAVQEIEAERNAVQRELEVSETARMEAESASAEVQQTQDELVAARAEADSLREQVEHLCSMVGERRGNGEAPQHGPAQGDRKAVEGYPGVYSRQSANGDTYFEIGWRVDGKQRWKKIGDDLQEAAEARAAVVAGLSVTEPVPA